jgi:hypothetical protein
MNVKTGTETGDDEAVAAMTKLGKDFFKSHQFYTVER